MTAKMTAVTITGEMLVEQARTWIGTPYHHAARAKGAGVDCVGLIVGAARELGVSVPSDTTSYGRGDNLALMHAGLSEFCDCFESGLVPDRQPGDILIFRGGSILHHIALYCGLKDSGLKDSGLKDSGDEAETMIHVYNTVGKVVEQPITPEWERLLFRVYRLRDTDLERGSC